VQGFGDRPQVLFGLIEIEGFFDVFNARKP
jgi:hypothetical protein